MRLGAEHGARRRGRWAVLLGLVVPAVSASTACGDDDPQRVRLTVTSQGQIPSQLDRVSVTVIAARRDDPLVPDSYRTCESVTGEFTLLANDSLPLYVDYLPGTRYDFWVAFRVEFWRGSMLLSTDEWMASLGDSGTSGRTVNLDTECASRSVPCDAGLKCVTGLCVDPGGAGPFDHPELVDPGTPCSRLDAPADGH
ncbi:MAG: hypothetical protein JXB32_09555 [Deltaproteobacteria bacterium]|nr:hypothetical protein [Deltaproteobacteria bacterium]